MVLPVRDVFGCKQQYVLKGSFNIGMYFFLHKKIPRVFGSIGLLAQGCTQDLFLLSQNVDFYLHAHAYLLVTRCLLQIQPLHLHGRLKETVKYRTCFICLLLQRKLSTMPPFSTKFCSDLAD